MKSLERLEWGMAQRHVKLRVYDHEEDRGFRHTKETSSGARHENTTIPKGPLDTLVRVATFAASLPFRPDEARYRGLMLDGDFRLTSLVPLPSGPLQPEALLPLSSDHATPFLILTRFTEPSLASQRPAPNACDLALTLELQPMLAQRAITLLDLIILHPEGTPPANVFSFRQHGLLTQHA